MAKILLVEDDNNLREIYEARLQAEGYDIVAARDGEEALVIAKSARPDLVISDVMMPKISGFEMLDILRNTDGMQHVKVIMLTALGQSEDQKRADSLGADRYLVKSQVTLEDIVNVSQQLLMEAGAIEAEPVPEEPAVAAPAPIAAPDPQPVATAIPVAAPPSAMPIVAPEPVITPVAVAPALEPTPPPEISMPPAPEQAPPAMQPPAVPPVVPDPVTSAPALTVEEQQLSTAPQQAVAPVPEVVPEVANEPVTPPMPETVPATIPETAPETAPDPETAPEQPAVAEEAPAPVTPVETVPTAEETPEPPVAAEPKPLVYAPVQQTEAEEEAAIIAQIEQFVVGQPEAAPPQAEPEVNDAAVIPEVTSPETTPITAPEVPTFETQEVTAPEQVVAPAPVPEAVPEVVNEPVTPPVPETVPETAPDPETAPEQPAVAEEAPAPVTPVETVPTAEETPEPPVAAEPAATNQDRLLADAVKDLSGDTTGEGPIEPKIIDEAPHKKIISPISNPDAPKKSLDELLAEEEAREMNNANIPAQPVKPPANNSDFDPNSIAL